MFHGMRPWLWGNKPGDPGRWGLGAGPKQQSLVMSLFPWCGLTPHWHTAMTASQDGNTRTEVWPEIHVFQLSMNGRCSRLIEAVIYRHGRPGIIVPLYGHTKRSIATHAIFHIQMPRDRQAVHGGRSPILG